MSPRPRTVKALCAAPLALELTPSGRLRLRKWALAGLAAEFQTSPLPLTRWIEENPDAILLLAEILIATQAD